MRTGDQLRDEILTAARTEFAQYGLAGARIDRIAKAAQASKERLYAHFGDKETLFRQVVSADGAAFFDSLVVRPGALAQLAGDIFDQARSHPQHLRMITWAWLEGLTLPAPEWEGRAVQERDMAAIAEAQARGLVDTRWAPENLLVMLLGMGLAWAHWPGPDPDGADEAVVASRRADVVEAAARMIAPRTD